MAQLTPLREVFNATQDRFRAMGVAHEQPIDHADMATLFVGTGLDMDEFSDYCLYAAECLADTMAKATSGEQQIQAIRGYTANQFLFGILWERRRVVDDREG